MKDRIIALMKQMGMSQKTFASEICISEGALSSIFNGRTKPTLNTVNNIHERFPEVNMGWLIDGKGEMLISGAQVPPSAGTNEAGEATVASQAAGQPVQGTFPEHVLYPQQTPSQVPPQMPYTAAIPKNPDKPMRRISEIRVFYDDGTFEVFPGNA